MHSGGAPVDDDTIPVDIDPVSVVVWAEPPLPPLAVPEVPPLSAQPTATSAAHDSAKIETLRSPESNIGTPFLWEGRSVVSDAHDKREHERSTTSQPQT